MRGLWTWLRAHIYVVHLLGVIVDRLEALEAAVFHGHPVYAVWVPDGMGVAEAWRQQNEEGTVYNGGATKHFILTDPGGNILKVVK